MRHAWTQKLQFCSPYCLFPTLYCKGSNRSETSVLSLVCLHRLMHYLCISQCVLKIFSLNHTRVNLVLKAQIVGRVQSRTPVNFSCDYRLNNIALQVEAKIAPFQH